MCRFSLTALSGVILLLGSALPGAAQMPVQDWTARPDARAPSGIRGDALLAPRSYEIRYQARFLSFQDVLIGTDEIPPILILQDWQMVPLSMSTQRHEIEIEVGILDWLGGSIRVPINRSSAEFGFAINGPNDPSFVRVGTPSTTGVGDVELHLLYALHDQWPYRAHFTAGISAPTGAIDRGGETPDQPGQEQILPYSMQPGDGTWGFLPGAVFVAENEYGTVGLQAEARVPLGENDREWSRGTDVHANLWMGYRFTDWVSGSLGIRYQKMGELSGFDPSVPVVRSPMHHPFAQGGTRMTVPIGMNVLFGEGPLLGNRLSVEYLLPGHQDLNGPQLKMKHGFSLTWAVHF